MKKETEKGREMGRGYPQKTKALFQQHVQGGREE
jgi:hypothetical protein